jgi:hypothetical protein
MPATTVSRARRLARVFAATAAGFALCIGIFAVPVSWIAGNLATGLVASLIAGAGFGVAMALLLGFAHEIAARRSTGVRDAAVRQEETFVLDGELDDAVDLAMDGLYAIGAGVLSVERGPDARLAARRGWSWKSFGEDMSVEVTPLDRGVRVVVRSRPRLRTTLVDYGRNLENVQAVRAAMERAPPIPTA